MLFIYIILIKNIDNSKSELYNNIIKVNIKDRKESDNYIMLMSLILIAVLQLVYVPLMTLRVLMMVKGYKGKVFILGFFETAVNITGASIVLSGDLSTPKIVVYALSYAIGLLIGIWLEQKMAIGHRLFGVNLKKIDGIQELMNELREEGFGVTKFEGSGTCEFRYKLEILANRRDDKKIKEIVSKYDNHSFMHSYEPTGFEGGFLKNK